MGLLMPVAFIYRDPTLAITVPVKKRNAIFVSIVPANSIGTKNTRPPADTVMTANVYMSPPWFYWISMILCNFIGPDSVIQNCRRDSRNPATFPVVNTVYPKKYAHGFCFAVLCCGNTLTDFPIPTRLTSLALWQSNDCPSASKATLMNMDKYFMWIHYERLYNQNKAKHNKTVCIFLGIYCSIHFCRELSLSCVDVLQT